MYQLDSRAGRRGGRRGVIFCHILPYQNVSFCYDKLVKLIGITSENPDGAKRTRTADPLHAMQVLYQLSYGPKNDGIALEQSFVERTLHREDP